MLTGGSGIPETCPQEVLWPGQTTLSLGGSLSGEGLTLPWPVGQEESTASVGLAGPQPPGPPGKSSRPRGGDRAGLCSQQLHLARD